MTPSATVSQINNVISRLISASMTDHQRYPSVRTSGQFTNIGIEGAPDLSISLRNITYADVFVGLFAAGAYHLRLIDGALIQLLYSFDRQELYSHRLCYFPSPALASYDEAAQIYEDDEMFAEIFSGNTVRAPIRFDYSVSSEKHVDVDHPKSHMTIGQYKGCRIPVSGPISPMKFMKFVLRNFYNSAYSSINLDALPENSYFPPCISARERQILHIRA